MFDLKSDGAKEWIHISVSFLVFLVVVWAFLRSIGLPFFLYAIWPIISFLAGVVTGRTSKRGS